jgi:CHAT domain-containing protein
MDRFYCNLLGKRDGLDRPMGKAAALAEAKAWLKELTSEEAGRLLAGLTKGVDRGAGAKAPALVAPAVGPKAAKNAGRPFAHPRYWAAFILIGDPN